ncbi:MAG: ThiF family adenylyltransferase [Promethearchaeota archaeon]
MVFKYGKRYEWSDNYWNQINRNIGPLKFSEQEKIRKTPIGIFGVGGLGGPLVEQLVRAGCEQLTICDHDKFDSTNLNRQICINDDIGKNKVDVLEIYMKKINPEIQIQKFYKVDEKTISKTLKEIKIVALTLDDFIASIIISRECRKLNIPMLESWAIPCLWAWWFTSESIDYESCYKLKTQGMTIKQILEVKKDKSHTNELFLPNIFQIPGIQQFYDREPGFFDQMISGTLGARSFAPIVRLCASFLALDLIFAGILKVKKKIIAPRILAYDYFRFKIIDFDMI